MTIRRLSIALVSFAALLVAAPGLRAQCPEEPRFDNHSGAGSTVCPCFVEGEHAGAQFTLPAGEFPIEILRVGIGWGSLMGGTPAQLEDSLNIYEGGLPDPGPPVFSLAGPEMNDGFINEFDLEPQPGEIIVNSSPFTVTLRFLNDNNFDPNLPSVVHDGTGCQFGKNVVFAIPGGWTDGCFLGIGGQWVFYVVYRKAECGAVGAGAVPDGRFVVGLPMTASLEPDGKVTLDWSPSCNAGDTDFEVYEGTIRFFYNHDSRFCSTGGATTISFNPIGGSTYYLVVPHDGTQEGSYGVDSNDVERPQGGFACRTQQIGTCP